MNNEWEIKSRSRTCTKTNREFAGGEFFYTLLFREKAGFRREDLCEEAWNERNDNIQPFSFWRSKYENPPPPPPEALKKDDAEGMLRQMLEAPRPEFRNARFILAVMLERKKILRPLESKDEDLLVYEHVTTGEVFAIENPRLSMDRIPEVQREVSQLLGGPLPS